MIAKDATSRPGASPALTGESVMLRLLYFLIYGSGAAWVPFFSVYLRQIGLSGLQIGTLTSINPAVTVVSQPLWGVIADLWGRRRTLLLTALLGALVIPGFGWGTGFWFFVGWSVLYTLLSNPVPPLFDALVLDHVERMQSLFYGHLRLWGAIAWAIVAYAVGRAIEGQDIRLIFVVAAGLMLLAWFLALRTLRKTEGVSGALHNRWVDLGRLLRSRRLLIFILMVAALKVGTAATFTFFSIYMDELGASRQLIGLAYGIQGLSELPLFLIATPLIRRLGPTRVLVVAFLFLSIRPLLYSMVTQPGVAVAAQLLHGSLSLFLVASVEYVNRLVPSAWRATGQSLFWAANMGIGAILGNTLSGYLYDQVGVRKMYGLSGLFILTVAVVAWLVLHGRDGAASPDAA